MPGAGIGQHLGSIDGDVAQLYQSRFVTQSQPLHEQSGQRFQMLLAKTSDGVMVGMLIGSQIAECDVVIGGAFNRTRAGDADAIAVQQQAREQQWVIGRESSTVVALVLCVNRGQIQLIGHIRHEPGQMPIRQPVL